MKNVLVIVIDSLEKSKCPYNPKKLNRELLSYILDEIKGFDPRKKFVIEVTCLDHFTEKEKQEFVSILRSNLKEDIAESYIEMRFICIRAIILAIVGVLSIFLYFWLTKADLLVFKEFLLMLGWIGIWEALELFMFDNVSSRMKIKRYKRLVKAPIKFIYQ